EERDCVVLTQSCDLANDKAPLVALCPVFSLPDFEAVNKAFAQKGVWERVRQGRVEGLHLLASPTEPSHNRACLVVDFRQIYSLPVGYFRFLPLTWVHAGDCNRLSWNTFPKRSLASSCGLVCRRRSRRSKN